jgi:hypothetical protein
MHPMADAFAADLKNLHEFVLIKGPRIVGFYSGADLALEAGYERFGKEIAIRALIDTGSDLSVVHPQILQRIGAGATGAVRIRRPGRGVRLPARRAVRR